MQFQHQRLVDAGAGVKVELVERLVGREPGGFQPTFPGFPFPFDQFQFTQLQ